MTTNHPTLTLAPVNPNQLRDRKVYLIRVAGQRHLFSAAWFANGREFCTHNLCFKPEHVDVAYPIPE